MFAAHASIVLCEAIAPNWVISFSSLKKYYSNAAWRCIFDFISQYSTEYKIIKEGLSSILLWVSHSYLKVSTCKLDLHPYGLAPCPNCYFNLFLVSFLTLCSLVQYTAYLEDLFLCAKDSVSSPRGHFPVYTNFLRVCLGTLNEAMALNWNWNWRPQFQFQFNRLDNKCVNRINIELEH